MSEDDAVEVRTPPGECVCACVCERGCKRVWVFTGSQWVKQSS